MDLDSNYIKKLYEYGIIQVGEFTLKSGDKSPIYIDLRIIPSTDLFSETVDIYCKLIEQLPERPDYIAGIMSAGIPFASGISLKLGIPMLQIRKKAKGYGNKKLVEGLIDTNRVNIVLIDDLVSTGSSKKDAVDALRDLGMNVSSLVVLLDRTNKSGKDSLNKLNLKLYSAVTLSELIQKLSHIIPEKDQKMLKDALDKWNK